MNELEKLYKEIQPKIYSFFYVKTLDSAAAEDLTHDVFYEALKSFSSFSGKSSLQTWLFSIAQNLLKKYYRSKKYKNSLEHKLMDNEKDVRRPDTPEEIYLAKETKRGVIRQIDQLDELQKEIVILRIYGELSFKEIAELVNKSENFARVAFHRAKLKLQKEMRVSNE